MALKMLIAPTLTVTLFRALVVVTAAGGAVAAGPVATPAALAYRLNVEDPDAFRLPGRAAAPAPEPAPKAVIPAHLASRPFAVEIDLAARRAALDPALVHALIYVESRYNPVARSPKGALGLMQVLPETASRYGVTDPGRSPEANLLAGTRYLIDLMELFDNRLDLVLAAYNAGENAVIRFGHRIPPFPETRLYVPAELAKDREWQDLSPVTARAAVVSIPTRIQYMPGTTLDREVMQASGHR